MTIGRIIAVTGDQTSGYKDQTSGRIKFKVSNLNHFDRIEIVYFLCRSDVWLLEPDVWSSEK